MDVQIYVLLVTLLGAAISHALGRYGLTGSWLSSAFFAFALGLLLTFALPALAMGVCSLFGVTKDTSCIATDDRTVWSLVFPLVAFPLYLIVMRVSRTRS